MAKTCFTWLWLLIGLPLWAQQYRVEHQLLYHRQEKTLTGQSTFTFAPARYGDSLLLHLPPRAISQAQSFYRTQQLEWQNSALHFARSAELGHIRIHRAQLGERELSLKSDGEFLAIALPSQADSLQLHLAYEIRLPKAGLAPSGANDWGVSLIDWLPRLPTYHDSVWQPVPVNFYGDDQAAAASVVLDLELESVYKPVGNLPQVGPETASSPSHRLWRFRGRTRQLQVHWRADWREIHWPQGPLIYQAGAGYPPEQWQTAWRTTNAFMQKELGDSNLGAQKVVLLPQKIGEYQSKGMLSLPPQKKAFQMEAELLRARAESVYRYAGNTSSWQQPWLGRGLPYSFKYWFIRSQYPQETWVPFGQGALGKLFALDQYDYAYQNQFLFWFLARQNLDQALNASAEELTRLNYEAIVQAKAYMAFNHLRALMGEHNFRRGLQRWGADGYREDGFSAALQYYSNRPLGWFFEDFLASADKQDYRLSQFEQCPNVTTVKVRNTGQEAWPYSLTGYRNGQAVITEWFAGHEGTRRVSMHPDDYDYVELNTHANPPEFRLKNNRVYPGRLMPQLEPLQFTFYNSFEKRDRSQLFWFPTLSYNAYDQLLVGINLTNTSYLVQKPWEFSINPDYSTGTGRLTGSGSLVHHYLPLKTSWLRQISGGLYFQYYHYDRDLSFFRFSPSLSFWLRKPYPRSPLIQRLRFRAVRVDREQATMAFAPEPGFASYSVFHAQYSLENTHILHPLIHRLNFEIAENFSKFYSELDQRWMLPNRKWLILRLFGGVFAHNTISSAQQNYFGFGLSGTQDYLFDYDFIGRSDESGIWSQQFFSTDGGFRSGTGVFAQEYLLSSNLSLPLYSFLGLYGDAALADGDTYWGYGVRLAFLTDFLELYLPLADHSGVYWNRANYAQYLRFVLELDLGTIQNRLRRGFY